MKILLFLSLDLPKIVTLFNILISCYTYICNSIDIIRLVKNTSMFLLSLMLRENVI